MLDEEMKRKVNELLSTSQMWNLCGSLQEKEHNAYAEQNLGYLKDAIYYAVEKIEIIEKIFPEFTLHGLQHSYNVLLIMEKLLCDMRIIEDEKAEISSYEIAMLILAAFYHDIGMVLPDKNYDITQERGYVTFSREKKYLNEDDLRKRYIRECHHIRAELFLDRYNQESDNGFKWLEKNGNRKYFLGLERICASHNQGEEALKELDNTLGQDEKFCAIILRLADILDLDNTRAPMHKMEDIKYKEMPESWIHWRKHSDSEGPIFDGNGILKLTGKVEDAPRIYSALNYMVKLINIELNLCNMMIRSTSAPFRDRKLPQKIYNAVETNGFEAGEYSYEIEKKNIIKLFMGENLYMDKLVFIRELLQNSIDATIYYQKLVEKQYPGMFFGKSGMNLITIHIWNDGIDSVSFLIQDGGMGMNRNTIQNYFLKIGKSFFESDMFRHSGIDFMPISRFGVGFLSAFLVTNEVVVLTKHYDNPKILLQLILNIAEDEYILREDDENINKYQVHQEVIDWDGNAVNLERMFDEKKNGTIIYFKIKEEIINGNMDYFVNAINKYLFIAPPVGVECNINDINLVYNEGLAKPFMKYISMQLEKDDVCRAIHKNLSSMKDEDEILFESLPVDISFSDDYGKINGKLQVLTVYDTKLKHGQYNFSYSLDYENDMIHIRLGSYQKIINNIELNPEYDKLGISNKVKIYFNGINHLSTLNEQQTVTMASGFLSGYLSLEGKFRPEVGVARNGAGRLDLITMAHINYQYWNEIQKYVKDDMNKRTAYFSLEQPDILLNLNKVIYTDYEVQDKVIQKCDWNELSLIQTEKGFLSVNEIQEYFRSHDELEIELLECVMLNKISDFRSLLVAYLLNTNFDIVIKISEKEDKIFVKTKENMEHRNVSLPPLFFAEYENLEILKYGNYPLNSKHWFSKWLIDTCKTENFQDYKYYLIRNFRNDLANNKSKREELVKNINNLLSKYVKTKLDNKDMLAYKENVDLRTWLEVV